MGFKDLLKNSVLDKVQGSAISADVIIATMIITCILALYIFAVYYLSQRNSFYNKAFNISLALIAIITSGIILAMQSSLVISLGMVGALSIDGRGLHILKISEADICTNLASAIFALVV